MIDIGHSSFPYFPTLYVAAYLACFFVLIVEGRRHKLPLLPWLLVIATGFVFFILGCRIFTYSANEWSSIVSYRSPDHLTGLFMLGGIALAVPAILASKRFLCLNEFALDAYALVLPIGMCIQRIGCLLAGCCYGTPNSLFGILYQPGTPAFREHLISGMISHNASHSLSIHPVQLYESVGCLLSIILLVNLRNRMRSPGSLFYASGLCYYLVRFAAEFFRSQHAYAIEVDKWLYLNTIQWSLLALIVMSALIVLFKELSPGPEQRQAVREIGPRSILYFFFLSVIFFFASKFLKPLETFVVCVVLITTAGYLVIVLFNKVTVPQLRLASFSLLLLSMALMSQTYPEAAESDSTRISYNTFSIGGLWAARDLNNGSYDDCTGKTAATSNDFQTKYQIIGMGFSRTIQKKEANSFTWGISGYYGKFKEDVHHRTGYPPNFTDYYNSRTINTFGINPYLQWDSKYVGGGVGLHFGELLKQVKDPDEFPLSQLSSVDHLPVFPQAYLRIGRMDRIFGEVSIARNFPSNFPGLTFQADLGFSITRDYLNNGVVRIGTSTASALFLASSFPVGEHFVLEPYLGFITPIFGTGDPSEAFDSPDRSSDKSAIGSIGLHYKFGKKPVKHAK